VWVAEAYASWSITRLLHYCLQQLRLSKEVEIWELPTKLLKGDEPWEYRPRAKVRKLVTLKYGHLLNALVPGVVNASVLRSSAYNLNEERNVKFAAQARHLLRSALLPLGDRRGGCSVCTRVCDALLGCFEDGCMLRDASGSLREPSKSHQPYDPLAPLAEKRRRFDNEPWHFWDLPKQTERGKDDDGVTVASVLLILANLSISTTLGEVVPLVLPSLGLLLPFGIRLRLRLNCAVRIAKQLPELFERTGSAQVYADVYRICRPELLQANISDSDSDNIMNMTT
jgi:hypothetical protein